MLNKIIFSSNDLHIYNVQEESNLVKIDGTAAHFNTPNLNGEIVDAKSFENFFSLYNDGKITPAFTYNHDPNMLIGGIDRIYIDGDTLRCSAHINKDIAFCRDTLIPMVLAGDVKSYSTEGYISYDDIEERENNTYYAANFLLTTVSAVTVPADYKSEFTIKNMFDEEAAKRAIEEENNKPQRKVYLLV